MGLGHSSGVCISRERPETCACTFACVSARGEKWRDGTTRDEPSAILGPPLSNGSVPRRLPMRGTFMGLLPENACAALAGLLGTIEPEDPVDDGDAADGALPPLRPCSCFGPLPLPSLVPCLRLLSFVAPSWAPS